MKRLNGLEIGPVNFEQFVGERARKFRKLRLWLIAAYFEQELAGERIAVGVQTVGGKPKENVASANGLHR